MSSKGSDVMPQGDPKVREAVMKANKLLTAITGREGGLLSEVDWYTLRNHIADALYDAARPTHGTADQLIRTTAEQERLRFQGYIDDWMKVLGTGVNGHQEEALTLMDMACGELVRARAKIDALRLALEPFSAIAGEMFARNFNRKRIIVALDNTEKSYTVRAHDFFEARRVYGDTDPNER